MTCSSITMQRTGQTPYLLTSISFTLMGGFYAFHHGLALAVYLAFAISYAFALTGLLTVLGESRRSSPRRVRQVSCAQGNAALNALPKRFPGAGFRFSSASDFQRMF